MDYPPGFPDRFRPIAEAAILKAEHKSKRKSVQQLIKSKLFAFAEVACLAAEAKAWQPETALSGLESFIDVLCKAESNLIDSEEKRRLSRASQFVFSTEPAKPEVAQQRRFEQFKRRITDEITSSREWRGYIERLANAVDVKVVEEPESVATDEQSRKTKRTALLERYRSQFPDAAYLDICWASKQHYREWQRWISGKAKDGSKPDRCFRLVLTSNKNPQEHRPEPRPKQWK
jgi:hypothetical protein